MGRNRSKSKKSLPSLTQEAWPSSSQLKDTTRVFVTFKLISPPTLQCLTRLGRLSSWRGVASIAVGVLSGFTGRLIFLGHIAVVVGCIVDMGVPKSWKMIYRPDKLRATLFIVLGFFLILLGQNIVGLLLETIGFLSLNDYDRLLVL
ncbi:hypothetical protein BC829DRAFT_120364 [Chytridium lagenaria]|nr:hypothetical protein BC829DRAFT_120364 [Chytridium lagenaria]